MTISRMLALFGAVITLTLVASFSVVTYTLQELKIRGPEYTDIVNGKDLIADILPPPLYVIEAYLLATEGSYHEEKLKDNITKAKALREAYDARKAFWAQSSLDEGVKTDLATNVIATGDIFWQAFDRFAADAGNSADADTKMARVDDVMAAFYTHQDAVNKTVAVATSFLSEAEHHADKTANTLLPIALGGAAVSVALFALGLYGFRRRAIRPLANMKCYMATLAQGDYSKDVPFADRTDEIGEMSKAVAVFRQNAIERMAQRKRAESAQAEEVERERQAATLQAIEIEKRQHVLSSLTDALGQLASGNLSYRLGTTFAEGYEGLRHEFNKSLESLSGSMREIAQTTVTVRNSSAEIASSSEQLSKRTEQQAATIEETAAALDQITATVKHTSDRAREAADMMSKTRSSADRSATIVQEATSAMQRIAGSSSQIGQIINVIDEIAFQTNLLALNAGVEAARAGEAGKGFAVVAQEVRELASRSATAAKEIKTLVSASSEEVSTGVSLVNRTGEALSEIGHQVIRVSDIIGEIRTASSEQADAVGEINRAVNLLDQSTQQNAAMAEETYSACRSLNGEAESLDSVVGKFNVDSGRMSSAKGELPQSAKAA